MTFKISTNKEMLKDQWPMILQERELIVAYPLNTCCCPRPSPVIVVSLSRVFSPLSTETWAMPAPISPAPRMASCLEGQDQTVVVTILGVY